MFVPFTLFHVDRHLKKLDNHSQFSVEQIGSDCSRIDLRASVFQKFSGGSMPPDDTMHDFRRRFLQYI